jgi:hypothetical protein
MEECVGQCVKCGVELFIGDSCYISDLQFCCEDCFSNSSLEIGTDTATCAICDDNLDGEYIHNINGKYFCDDCVSLVHAELDESIVELMCEMRGD